MNKKSFIRLSPLLDLRMTVVLKQTLTYLLEGCMAKCTDQPVLRNSGAVDGCDSNKVHRSFE